MKDPESGPLESAATLEGRTPFQRYAFALAATAMAFLVRLALDSKVGDKFPFAAFIIAVILVTWYGDFGPGLVTFALGFALANWFFIPPRHTFEFSGMANIGTNITSSFVSLTIIFFGRNMHLARRRADANARRAIRHQKELEVEVVERKRAEEVVRELNAELEKRVEQRTAELVASNQELESFTYSVSHDLRAPLRHVDGYAQILREEFGPQLPEDAQKLIGKIRQGSENMGRLVDDLLNLSRIGKAELSRKSTPLQPLVEEVVNDLKLDSPNRKIEWQIEELPPMECDPGLIRQVFANLLANAVKYTRPREQARIEIGQAKTNGETAIYVRDNGVGFNMKYVAKLFGVFQRLHRAEEFEGTGVGLATVARIVRKHGGRVWAEAELNHGATFFFTLAGQPGEPAAPVNGNGNGKLGQG
jgi:signal transduction histidine kinase